MGTLKVISIALALAALASGLLAAWYWYRSTKEVPVDTLRALYGGPEQSAMDGVSGLFETGLRAAKWNQKAAIWTAVTAVLSALSAAAGAVSN